MIKFEHIQTSGWEAAIRGLRNPMNSWDRSDSFINDVLVLIGAKDLDLMHRMNASTEQSKYRRMIVVSMDITAPLYWWKEFDTYKVGTVANSCSTMHKLGTEEITLHDFSTDHLTIPSLRALEDYISVINLHREMWIDSGKKDRTAWWQMIQLLPTSYNQKRTVLMNYEVLASIYRQRQNHKLDEWREFCKEIEDMPYSEIITDKRVAAE